MFKKCRVFTWKKGLAEKWPEAVEGGCHPSSTGSGHFRAKPFSLSISLHFLKIGILHLSAYEMEKSVPKRRHIKFRHRGITQKKAYNIQNTAKV
jgi:hypothetical protein